MNTTTPEYRRGQALGSADTPIKCATCGVEYKIPRALFDTRFADHSAIYCPFGHKSYYNAGKSRAEVLEEQLAYQRAEAEAARKRVLMERRKHAATKGQLTKTKKRVAGGACPCCNRTFVDVGRHMKSKHPGYAAT